VTTNESSETYVKFGVETHLKTYAYKFSMKQCLEINNGKHSGGVKDCHVQE
jgi:hypothetical protein